MTAERTVVALLAGPHAGAHLKGVLEQLVARRQRWEGHAQALAFLLIVAGPDPEPGPPPGEDVEGGHGFGQHGGVPEVGAGGNRQQTDRAGAGRHEGEHGVGLEAVHFGAAHDRVLPNVIGDGDAIQPALVGERGDVGQHLREVLGTGRPVECDRCGTSFTTSPPASPGRRRWPEAESTCR